MPRNIFLATAGKLADGGILRMRIGGASFESGARDGADPPAKRRELLEFNHRYKHS